MIRCAARLAVAACAAAVLARLAVPRSRTAAVWMHARSKVGVATMTVAVARVKKPARLEEAGIAVRRVIAGIYFVAAGVCGHRTRAEAEGTVSGWTSHAR